MNRFTLTVLFGFIGILLFLFDKSIQGIFDLANYFSFSITFLIILINMRKIQTFIPVFFIFGLLTDWFNKSFLGLYSLLSTVIAYVYNLLKLRVAGNKIALFISNFITAYFLYLISFNFDNIMSSKAFTGALLTTLLSSPMWLREK